MEKEIVPGCKEGDVGNAFVINTTELQFQQSGTSSSFLVVPSLKKSPVPGRRFRIDTMPISARATHAAVPFCSEKA